MEKFKKKTLDVQMTGVTQGTMTTAQTMTSLITQDQSVASDKALESPWRGCEAYHLYLLAQRQLYEGQCEAAMRTSIRLAEYEDILDAQSIFSLMALATYYNKFFMQCSKAFIKLEASSDIAPDMQKKFGDLALKIFTRNLPRDPSTRMATCPKCKTRMYDWLVNCPSCSHRLPFCVASGRSIFPPDEGAATGPGGADIEAHRVVTCRTCRHKMFASEHRKLRNCPLCHSRIDTVGPGR